MSLLVGGLKCVGNTENILLFTLMNQLNLDGREIELLGNLGTGSSV